MKKPSDRLKEILSELHETHEKTCKQSWHGGCFSVYQELVEPLVVYLDECWEAEQKNQTCAHDFYDNGGNYICRDCGTITPKD